MGASQSDPENPAAPVPTTESVPHEPIRRHALTTLAKSFGIALVLLVLFWGTSHFFLRPFGHLIERTNGAFLRVFGIDPPPPIVRGDSAIVVKTSIEEVALAQHKVITCIKYEAPAWRGTKILILKGVFLVKAGFDFKEPYRIDINNTTGDVSIELPAPKILSIVPITDEIFYSSDALLNKLTPEDHKRAMDEMKNQARIDSEASDIREDAKREVRNRIHDLLDASAHKVTLHFADDLPAKLDGNDAAQNRPK